MKRRLFSLITALFLLGSTTASSAKVFPYTDVSVTDENKAAVEMVVKEGLMQEASPTTFNPDGNVTLKNCLTAIGKAYMQDTDKPKWPSIISGASKSNTWWVYVDWAYRSGLLDDWIRQHGGVKRDAKKRVILNLDEAVTHKDYVRFLHKAQTPIPYNDKLKITVSGVPKGCYYYQAAGWAMEQNLTPWVKKSFSPDTNLTRMEMAISLYRDIVANEAEVA